MSYVRYTVEYLCNVKARDIDGGCPLQTETMCTLYERKRIFSMENNSNEIMYTYMTLVNNKLYMCTHGYYTTLKQQCFNN